MGKHPPVDNSYSSPGLHRRRSVEETDELSRQRLLLQMRAILAALHGNSEALDLAGVESRVAPAFEDEKEHIPPMLETMTALHLVECSNGRYSSGKLAPLLTNAVQ